MTKQALLTAIQQLRADSVGRTAWHSPEEYRYREALDDVELLIDSEDPR